MDILMSLANQGILAVVLVIIMVGSIGARAYYESTHPVKHKRKK